MTRDDMAEMLAERCKRGAFFVTIEAQTVPEMRKTGNDYFGRIRKLSRVNGVLNWTYEKSVNSQREREGSEPDFVAEPRKWGMRIPHTCFIEHKGNLYLEIKVQRAIETSYTCDGEPIDVETIRPWFPKKRESGRQELDHPVIPRDYALTSIQAITLDKVRHVVTTFVPWYQFGGVG